jgi:sporulation protein YlmC with PRC-barrel domain
MKTVVHLERFVGKQVRDAHGRKIGHLHEVRARREGDELVVLDYLVGPAGMLERFSLAGMGDALLGVLGLRRASGYIVPWDRMDFSEAGRPRCTCAASELERISG